MQAAEARGEHVDGAIGAGGQCGHGGALEAGGEPPAPYFLGEDPHSPELQACRGRGRLVARELKRSLARRPLAHRHLLGGRTLHCAYARNPPLGHLRHGQRRLGRELDSKGFRADGGRDAVTAQHARDLRGDLRLVRIKGEDILGGAEEAVGRVAFHVTHERHCLTRRVRVREPPVGRHRAQLREEASDAPEHGVGHRGSVLAQQLELGGEVGVFDRVAAEHVAALAEKVVAQEREAGLVGENNRAEAGGDGQEPFARLRAARHDAPSVGEQHASLAQQAPQYGDHLEWRLVGFVHHEHTARCDGAHQRRCADEIRARSRLSTGTHVGVWGGSTHVGVWGMPRMRLMARDSGSAVLGETRGAPYNPPTAACRRRG